MARHQAGPVRRIEDYALIGDCESAALVGRDGSIDWLCWPRFDSAACFAALLGTPDNGRWLIAPAAGEVRATRRYEDGSLILVTRFETDEGTCELVDFMPPRDNISNLVRLVRGIEGNMTLRTEFILRFDYGQVVPWVQRLADRTLRAIAGPDLAVLRTPARLRGEDFKTVGRFTVAAGETVPFVLSYGPSNAALPPEIDAAEALAATERFWHDWSHRCLSAGPWSGRSATCWPGRPRPRRPRRSSGG